MRKYVIGFVCALALVAVYQSYQYVRGLQSEAAAAHLQARQGAEAFAFLATVLAKDKEGKPALTMGDALVRMVQAQLKTEQAQQSTGAQ